MLNGNECRNGSRLFLVDVQCVLELGVMNDYINSISSNNLSKYKQLKKVLSARTEKDLEKYILT